VLHLLLSILGRYTSLSRSSPPLAPSGILAPPLHYAKHRLRLLLDFKDV
jgi:hypothetical protein